MSWSSTWDVLALCLLVVFGPGLLIGWTIGLRRFWLLACAPALSTGLLGGWAVLLAVVGIGWNLLTVGLATVVTAGVLLGVPRLLRRRWQADRPPAGWLPFTILGCAVALALGALALKNGIVEPDAPPQTWDAVFHLNALQFIRDHQDASSLHLGRLTNPLAGTAFYPAGWHAMTSLAVTDSVVVAANVMSIVLVAVVFPLGCALLAATLMPRSRVLPGLAAVGSVCFVAFPSRMVSYGTLWPNALAYALLPVALALTVRLLERPRPDDATTPPRRAGIALALVVSLGAVTVAHPNATIAYAALVAALVVVAVVGVTVRAVRRRQVWRVVSLAVGVAAVVVGFVLAFGSSQMRSAVAYLRPTYAPPLDAIVEALTDSQLSIVGFGNTEQSWLLAALTLIGFGVALSRRRLWWLAASYVVVLVLHVAANDPSLPIGVLAGPWYSDAIRLGGLVVIVAVPLVALGLHLVVRGVLAALRALVPHGPWSDELSRPWRDGLGAAVVATVVLIAFVLGTGFARLQPRTDRVHADYGRSDDPSWPGIVSRGEIDLFERLADELPEDAVVLGNPFTGAPLLYALGDVDVVFTHFRGKWPAAASYLGLHLADIETDPKVCEAINELGITHLYVDPQLYWPEHRSQALYEGMLREVPEIAGLPEVDGAGPAGLYVIDVC